MATASISEPAMGEEERRESGRTRVSAGAVSSRISVALEQAADGHTWVHALSVPGCAVRGASPDEALSAFPEALAEWLDFLAARGEGVPSFDEEIEIAVDEWVPTDAAADAGGTSALFEADLAPLEAAEVQRGLERLGDLRGELLPYVRRLPAEVLDRPGPQGWTLRRVLDELARAQWWTVSRLGASPLADVPESVVARLDTAMALVVQQFTQLPDALAGTVLEIDGEEWTPRKVMRRLLWIEWSLGRAARRLLAGEDGAR